MKSRQGSASPIPHNNAHTYRYLRASKPLCFSPVRLQHPTHSNYEGENQINLLTSLTAGIHYSRHCQNVKLPAEQNTAMTSQNDIALSDDSGGGGGKPELLWLLMLGMLRCFAGNLIKKASAFK
jgi:hypothetical protein